MGNCPFILIAGSVAKVKLTAIRSAVKKRLSQRKVVKTKFIVFLMLIISFELPLMHSDLINQIEDDGGAENNVAKDGGKQDDVDGVGDGAIHHGDRGSIRQVHTVRGLLAGINNAASINQSNAVI